MEVLYKKSSSPLHCEKLPNARKKNEKKNTSKYRKLGVKISPVIACILAFSLSFSAEAYSQKKSVGSAPASTSSQPIHLPSSAPSDKGNASTLASPVSSPPSLIFPPLLKPKRRIDVICFSEGIKKALDALQQDSFSKHSVWDLSVLQRNIPLHQTLQKFKEGKVGVYLKTLDTKNTSYETLRTDLLKNGFALKSFPLMGKKQKRSNADSLGKKKRERYIRQDGTRTHDRSDPFLAIQEIYVHPEGSMVRIKPHGEPGGKRPQPHVIKAVLFDPAKGTGYNNEAFKITWNGKAVPKGPNVDFGLKLKPSPDENQGWIELIMQESHCDLHREKAEEID